MPNDTHWANIILGGSAFVTVCVKLGFSAIYNFLVFFSSLWLAKEGWKSNNKLLDREIWLLKHDRVKSDILAHAFPACFLRYLGKNNIFVTFRYHNQLTSPSLLQSALSYQERHSIFSHLHQIVLLRCKLSRCS